MAFTRTIFFREVYIYSKVFTTAFCTTRKTNMNIKTIKAPAGAKYLSDIFNSKSEYGSDLPRNCILNKKVTGCGATYSAIMSIMPTIIAVPTRGLVEDKYNQDKYRSLGLFPVSSDYPCDAIPAGCTRIICTYQSLPKVAEMIDISKWNLVVDEMHMLQRMISFSKNSLMWLMANFKNFASYCFVSATVPQNELMLKELRDIDVVEIEWPYVKEVSFNCLQTKNVRESVLQIVMEHHTGKRPGRPYFFYNSISGISSIIKAIKKINKSLDDKMKVSVISSKSKVTTEKLKSCGTTPKGSNECSDINFITSTAFEGQDFYDEEGVTYIVVDGDYRNTRYSMVTTIPQIVGRLRNSKYNSNISVLFTGSSPIRFTSEEELNAAIEENIFLAKGAIDGYYENVDRADRKIVKDAILTAVVTNGYIGFSNIPDLDIEDVASSEAMKFEDGRVDLELYEDARLLDIEEYHLLRTNMYINDPNAYNSEHIANKLTSCIGEADGLDPKYKKYLVDRSMSLEALCELYMEDPDECMMEDFEFFSYIKEYGIDRIKRLGYKKSEVKKLAECDDIKQMASTKRALTKVIKAGSVYTSEYIKAAMKSAGIKKCTASTIAEYFDVAPCKISGSRGYKILGIK